MDTCKHLEREGAAKLIYLQIDRLTFGGGHQQIRSGMLNVAGIVGLGLAYELRQQEMVINENAIF